MKKYSDDMQIESTVGVGTTVTLRVNLKSSTRHASHEGERW